MCCDSSGLARGARGFFYEVCQMLIMLSAVLSLWRDSCVQGSRGVDMRVHPRTRGQPVQHTDLRHHSRALQG